MGAISSVRRLTIECVELFETLEPTGSEIQRKVKCTKRLERHIQSLWSTSELKAFGSSANGLDLGDSDLDVTLLFQDWTNHMYNTLDRAWILKQILKHLQRYKYQIISFIEHARVPILKLWDPMYQVQCDLSVGNTTALLNTALLKQFSLYDPRVRPLIYAVKYWAKSRGINDASNGSLSSYAYVLMMIHFLQHRSTPLLPLMDQINDTDIVEASSFERDSIGSLMMEFFHYYTNVFDPIQQVVSIKSREIMMKGKHWKWSIPWRLSIADPYEITHDLGRVIYDESNQSTITFEFHRAHQLLLNGMSFQVLCQPVSCTTK